MHVSDIDVEVVEASGIASPGRDWHRLHRLLESVVEAAIVRDQRRHWVLPLRHYIRCVRLRLLYLSHLAGHAC